MCAGDGRDVIGVLRSHPRRSDVTARLVELNRRSVSAGVRQANAAGLADRVHFVHADATDYATYDLVEPSDVVLVCGVWGHVNAGQRPSLVRALESLCKPGGTVVWTRGVAKSMTRLHDVLSRFPAATWSTERTSVTPDGEFAVVTVRRIGPARERPRTGRIFDFERNAG